MGIFGLRKWDSVGKSLKGLIAHFSALLDGNKVELSTVDTTLKVGKSFGLYLKLVSTPDEDELPLLPPGAGSREVTWYVKGGQKFGSITSKPNKYFAKYEAPKYLSESDPKIVLEVNKTEIREVVQRSGKWRGKTWIPTTSNLATLTCNVHLYDEYKIKVVASWDNTTSHKSKLGTMKWVDSSSFRLRLVSGSTPIIKDTNNTMFLLVKEHFTPRCQFEYVNKTTCIGPVHVTGVMKGWGLSGDPGGNLTVKVDFETIPVVLPKLNIICKGSPQPSLPPLALRTYPNMIKFELKDGTQEQKPAGSAVLGEIAVKITRL
jgi:hypothetical protein